MAITISITLDTNRTATKTAIGAGNPSSASGYNEVLFTRHVDPNGTTKTISAMPGSLIYLWSSDSHDYPELQGNGISEVLLSKTTAEWEEHMDMLIVYKVNATSNISLYLS